MQTPPRRPLSAALLFGLLALGGPATAAAQDGGPPADAPPAPADEEAADRAKLQARHIELLREYDQALAAFNEAAIAAHEAGEEVDYDAYPLPKFYPRFVELADEGSLDASVWVLSNYMPSGEAAFGPLLERVLARDTEAGRELENVLYWLHYSVRHDFDPEGFDGAREVLGRYVAREDAAFRLPARVALARLTATLDQDPLAVEAAVEDYRELLAEEGLPEALRDRLQGELFVLTNLRVGLVAPDLVGTDVDGERLALSDYRGKVTVLEFWGFW